MDYLGKRGLVARLRQISDSTNQRLGIKRANEEYRKEETDSDLYKIEKKSEKIDAKEQKAEQVEDRKGFNHGEKGPLEKTMDRETFIAILRACGYPIPMTKEEWKEYIQKTADFLKLLNGAQSKQVTSAAKRTARRVVEATEETPQINKEKVRENAYIPLKKSKSKGLNVFEDFAHLSEEQKAVVVEAIVTGIRGQEKAIDKAVEATKGGEEQEDANNGFEIDL